MTPFTPPPRQQPSSTDARLPSTGQQTVSPLGSAHPVRDGIHGWSDARRACSSSGVGVVTTWVAGCATGCGSFWAQPAACSAVQTRNNGEHRSRAPSIMGIAGSSMWDPRLPPDPSVGRLTGVVRSTPLFANGPPPGRSRQFPPFGRCPRGTRTLFQAQPGRPNCKR